MRILRVTRVVQYVVNVYYLQMNSCRMFKKYYYLTRQGCIVLSKTENDDLCFNQNIKFWLNVRKYNIIIQNVSILFLSRKWESAKNCFGGLIKILQVKKRRGQWVIFGVFRDKSYESYCEFLFYLLVCHLLVFLLSNNEHYMHEFYLYIEVLLSYKSFNFLIQVFC